MKKVVKKHPMRDIILEFDEAVVPPEFEQKALNAYYELHDRSWDLKEHNAVMEKDLREADEMISNLFMECLVLQQNVEILEDALGIDQEEKPELPQGEMTIDVTDFFESVGEHNQQLQYLYQKIDDLTQRYNEDIDNLKKDEYEEDCPIEPFYFGVLDELYSRYEELSVDTVSLDDDHQAFLGVYSEIENVFWRNLDFGEEVFNKYRNLFDKSDDLYRRTEGVEARLNDHLSRNL